MKKVCMFLFIGVFLALMTALPIVAEGEETSKVKFSINVGGLFASISQGYDVPAIYFDARDEEASWTEAVANIGGKFGFDIGASIFPMPQLEVYASYSTYGGTALGDYTFTLPHMWWFEELLTASMVEVENEFKATVINIGLAFHPDIIGRIKPYFGAGASSVTVKMDLLDSISFDSGWEEYYVFDEYWWDWDYSEVNALALTGVGFTEESETVWGFHAKAGVNIELAKNISVFLEGRYLSATVKFERPEVEIGGDCNYLYVEDAGYYWYYDYAYSWTEEYEVDIDDELEIKVGGIQGIVGIKFSF